MVTSNFNPLVPNAPFPYPLKTSESLKVLLKKTVYWEQMG